MADLKSSLYGVLNATCRQIEGKRGFDNLLSLPDDLFENMSNLAFLHLGIHAILPKVPSFQGLSNLKRLLLALLSSATELPSFEPLGKLERLDLIYFLNMPALPDMAPLVSLVSFTTSLSMQVCCSGFLGSCDLTHPFCAPNPAAGFAGAQCIQEDSLRATAATRLVFAKNDASVCQTTTVVVSEPLVKERVDMCEGQIFRQCSLPNATSDANGSTICFNTRLQVLACTTDSLKVQARKLQIRRGVGCACDPVVEAWLGCT